MNLFLNRLFRAAKLDVGLYEEVIADRDTMFQAMMAVFIYSAASAYGGFGRGGVAGINFGLMTTLAGWYIWAFSTYMVGARMMPEAGTEPDRKTILRVIGFACAPGILRILGFIQGLGLIVIFIALSWMVAAATIGVKQALNYESTARALGVCIIGLIISIVFQLIMLVILFQAFPVSR